MSPAYLFLVFALAARSSICLAGYARVYKVDEHVEAAEYEEDYSEEYEQYSIGIRKCTSDLEIHTKEIYDMVEAFARKAPIDGDELKNSTKCFITCVLQAMKMMDDDYELSERIYAYAKESDKLKLRRCVDKGYKVFAAGEDDICNTLYNIAACASVELDFTDFNAFPNELKK